MVFNSIQGNTDYTRLTTQSIDAIQSELLKAGSFVIFLNPSNKMLGQGNHAITVSFHTPSPVTTLYTNEH
jgi:hypothetical protein